LPAWAEAAHVVLPPRAQQAARPPMKVVVRTLRLVRKTFAVRLLLLARQALPS